MAKSILQFPSLSAAQVSNPPRRGRLPKSIPDLCRVRAKRVAHKVAELVARKEQADQELRRALWASGELHEQLWSLAPELRDWLTGKAAKPDGDK
jgi:hypothetical protein